MPLISGHFGNPPHCSQASKIQTNSELKLCVIYVWGPLVYSPMLSAETVTHIRKIQHQIQFKQRNSVAALESHHAQKWIPTTGCIFKWLQNEGAFDFIYNKKQERQTVLKDVV